MTPASPRTLYNYILSRVDCIHLTTSFKDTMVDELDHQPGPKHSEQGISGSVQLYKAR